MAMTFDQFAAVRGDSSDVLGKILYYSLSSILVERADLERICLETGFPNTASSRVRIVDAFRSATGDIYDRKAEVLDGTARIFKIYCRDNHGDKATVSRELVKETLDESTNRYKKLANISLDRESGVFSYENLIFDSVDPLPYCHQAQELFELYQHCVSRKQVETMLEHYLDDMQAVKVSGRGKIYFIPRDRMHMLDLFEDFIAALEAVNKNNNPYRIPLDSNSMYVVDDQKQRDKMAAAFYNTVRREIEDYQERANHLIQTGNQSAHILDRWVLKIEALKDKKAHYEQILQRELHSLDEEFTTLGYLAQELRFRANSARFQKAA